MKFETQEGLIIPDVHEQIEKVKIILAKYSNVSWVVFLGDWFDNPNGYTEQTFLTVKWLKEYIDNPQFSFLWGNHDLHYAFPSTALMFSGFNRLKLELIQKNITKDNWDKFKLMHWTPTEKPSLCAHAGIHPSFLHPILGFDRDYLAQLEANTMRDLNSQTANAFVLPGKSRCRSSESNIGGITWLDWRFEFEPIEGLNQIVGHTAHDEVQIKTSKDSVNYNLDTHLNYFGVMDSVGVLRVEQI